MKNIKRKTKSTAKTPRRQGKLKRKIPGFKINFILGALAPWRWMPPWLKGLA
jgi:hypothetical protein